MVKFDTFRVGNVILLLKFTNGKGLDFREFPTDGEAKDYFPDRNVFVIKRVFSDGTKSAQHRGQRRLIEELTDYKKPIGR